MFKPLSMQHVSLKLLTEDVPLAAQILADSGMFNPETTTETVAEQLPEQPGTEFYRVFSSARSRLDKIFSRSGLSKPTHITPYSQVEFSQLQEMNDKLGDIWLQMSKLEEQLHQFNEQQTALKQLLETLKIFIELDVDLKLFQKSAQFLNLHIGTVPINHLEHFIQAIGLAEHFIDIFHRDEHIAYLVVAGPDEHQEKVSAILEHADFQPLTIPPEFHHHPQQVHRELSAKQTQLQEQIQAVETSIQNLVAKNRSRLEHAYQTLHHAAAYAQLTETYRGRGQLALIEGWFPSADLAQLEASLHEKLNRPFVFSTRKPTPSEYPKVPSLIRHHRLLAPYIALVKNYGPPRYGEFDPTLLFALTFIIMFGTMFGDVGHGALIATAGWYLRDKLKTFTPFLIIAGLSSMFFGFLYGSIFGYEEVILPALWLSPIHNPNVMLTYALYWGIGFILLATLITVINRWREGDYASALFNNTGLTGILLYLGGFYALNKWMATDTFNLEQQLAIIVPLLIILGYKWYENKMPFTERLLVTLIEGLESVINYLANTLSFLRVAAFSLNHAALAIAVFTLANMIGSPSDWLISQLGESSANVISSVANWLVIILGNLFIVILEGAIVTIQVLRLEYYEGFSRFFSGDGRTFSPLSVGLK
jgi:V/A-type H+/Na+-transporting ATPase subunit I